MLIIRVQFPLILMGETRCGKKEQDQAGVLPHSVEAAGGGEKTPGDGGMMKEGEQWEEGGTNKQCFFPLLVSVLLPSADRGQFMNRLICLGF